METEQNINKDTLAERTEWRNEPTIELRNPKQSDRWRERGKREPIREGEKRASAGTFGAVERPHKNSATKRGKISLNLPKLLINLSYQLFGFSFFRFRL